MIPDVYFGKKWWTIVSGCDTLILILYKISSGCF